jgi:prophage DNA circulation protein
MAAIKDFHNQWRDALVRGWSFRGVPFHVEQQALSSGRRNVEHEYPKRNDPYAEDMGKQAIHYTIQGYLVGPNYLTDKINLMQALEADDAGWLIDPLRGSMLVMCERYSCTESRDKGGYCVFEMGFAEAGTPGNSNPVSSTANDVNTNADNAAGAASRNLDQQVIST